MRGSLAGDTAHHRTQGSGAGHCPVAAEQAYRELIRALVQPPRTPATNFGGLGQLPKHRAFCAAISCGGNSVSG